MKNNKQIMKIILFVNIFILISLNVNADFLRIDQTNTHYINGEAYDIRFFDTDGSSQTCSFAVFKGSFGTSVRNLNVNGDYSSIWDYPVMLHLESCNPKTGIAYYSLSSSCDNIDLSVLNFCYDFDEEEYQLTLKNEGLYSIQLIKFSKCGDRGGTHFWYSKPYGTVSADIGDFSDFYNGKIITLKDGTLGMQHLFNYPFCSSFSVLPGAHSLDCREHQIWPEKMTNCKTGEQVWPEVTIQEYQTEVTIQEYQIFNLKIYYFIGGFILIAIIIFIIFKLIKISKKKKKEKKEVIQPQKEEKSTVIPTNISEAISVKNFTVKHGTNVILDNVDMDIKRGELVCLLGPSGSGKSTIIEAIVGRKPLTKGNIKIFDRAIKNKKIYDDVGFVPQHAELYMNQTVEQNLLSSATKWGIKNAKNKVDGILSVIELSQRKSLKVSKLSGGQLKLLSLGMELIRDPELLILDEPTTGLDPNTRNNIITILSRIVTKQNKTVFFTTHFMEDAEECDNVIIIAKGKIIAEGLPAKLEKRLPGHGKIVNLILDNVTDDLLKNIKKIKGVEKIISEGRNIKIITDEPNAVKFAQKVDEIGGVVNKTEVTNATMKEVFVYYTGIELEE